MRVKLISDRFPGPISASFDGVRRLPASVYILILIVILTSLAAVFGGAYLNNKVINPFDDYYLVFWISLLLVVLLIPIFGVVAAIIFSIRWDDWVEFHDNQFILKRGSEIILKKNYHDLKRVLITEGRGLSLEYEQSFPYRSVTLIGHSNQVVEEVISLISSKLGSSKIYRREPFDLNQINK